MNNTFLGEAAGLSNQGASANTFVGTGAGLSNTIGIFNTFLGSGAGLYNQGGSNDIYIGTSGPTSDEYRTIRVGVQGLQTAAYLAGITPGPPPNLPTVLVDANGR